jgi:hypothetical protein
MHFCFDSSNGYDDDPSALACLQGDFYHWVELLNHFEVFFETFIKPKKDL